MSIEFEYPDPQKVIGLSTSHYTGVVDWAKAYANGIRFGIIKAADGLDMGVKYFKENYRGAKENGVLVGAYTWLYKTVSAGTQAREFASFLKDYPTDINPTVDFEWTPSGNPDTSNLYGFVIPFENSYGKQPMIYTAPGYWNQYGSPIEFWAKYPLWQAEYDQGSFEAIRPWMDYDFLQFTEKGKGVDYGVPVSGEIACELNYWRGTYNELLQFCGLAELPTPEFQEIKVLSNGELA